MFFIGHKRRLGLLGAKRTTITVHRSEEILPSDANLAGRSQSFIRQGTSVSSEGDLVAGVDQTETGAGGGDAERCACIFMQSSSLPWQSGIIDPIKLF